MGEGLRLAEILTTSTAVANFLGAPDVSPRHVLSAVEMLTGRKTLDDLGRPQSPLLSRVTGAGSGVDPVVKALAQEWVTKLGGDARAELDDKALAEFEAELRTLESEAPGASSASLS